MSISSDEVIYFLGASFALGTAIGIGIMIWINKSKKITGEGFLPDDLHNWMLPKNWQHLFEEQDDPVKWAKDQLSELESAAKQNSKKEARIEEELEVEYQKVKKIKEDIINADTTAEKQSRAGTMFSMTMRRLANLRYKTDTRNELALPHARKERFLEAVVEGMSQDSIEDLMENMNIDVFQENPYGKTFALIEAEWESMNEIPGLQDKIMRDMLSVKDNKN